MLQYLPRFLASRADHSKLLYVCRTLTFGLQMQSPNTSLCITCKRCGCDSVNCSKGCRGPSVEASFWPHSVGLHHRAHTFDYMDLLGIAWVSLHAHCSSNGKLERRLDEPNLTLLHKRLLGYLYSGRIRRIAGNLPPHTTDGKWVVYWCVKRGHRDDLAHLISSYLCRHKHVSCTMLVILRS